MAFSAFDTKKIDEYSARAKEQWGDSPEYNEYQKKASVRDNETQQSVIDDFMQIFAEFGEMKSLDPADERVQLQVKNLQNYISEHFYNCTNQILAALGKMYSCNEEFTENIDNAGGKGTANFVTKAIELYCSR